MSRLARRGGARPVVLVCRADEGVLRSRLEARSQGSGITSAARLEPWSPQRATFFEPEELSETESAGTHRPADANREAGT